MRLKERLQKTMLVALMAIFLFSCKDDDKAPANQLTYNGQTKALKTGVLFLDQSGATGSGTPTVYYHEITAISEGLSVSNDEIIGKGNAFSIIVLSSTKTVEAGVYNFNDNEATEKAMDFISAAVVIDFDVTTGSGLIYEDATAGKVTVAKSGTDQYTIHVDTTIDGKPMKAHFSGKFTTILD